MSARVPYSCAVLLALAFFAARPCAAASETPPGWLVDRAARGPLSASLALDEHWAHWSLDSALPIGRAPARGRFEPAGSDRARAPVGFALSLSGLTARQRPGVAAASLSAVLDHGDAVRGRWLGVSTGGAATDGEPRAPLRLGVGAWRSHAPLQAEVGVVSSVVRLVDPARWFETIHVAGPPLADTLPPTDRLVFRAVDHAAVWTTAAGALRWRAGRIEIETVGGFTFGDAARLRRFAQASARIQISRRLLMTLSAGRRPASSLAFDASSQPHAMLGLQLAPWASSAWALAGGVHARATRFQSRTLPDGRLALYLRCHDARRVELAADVTDWRTLPMSPIGGGWWECVTPAEPGLHQVRIRMNDGAWEIPPGLARTVQDSEAPAGLLLVP